MLVVNKSTFGLALAKANDPKYEGRFPLKGVILIKDNDEVIGAFVEWEIFYQIQHFVHAVIERRSE